MPAFQKKKPITPETKRARNLVRTWFLKSFVRENPRSTLINSQKRGRQQTKQWWTFGSFHLKRTWCQLLHWKLIADFLCTKSFRSSTLTIISKGITFLREGQNCPWIWAARSSSHRRIWSPMGKMENVIFWSVRGHMIWGRWFLRCVGIRATLYINNSGCRIGCA